MKTSPLTSRLFCLAIVLLAFGSIGCSKVQKPADMPSLYACKIHVVQDGVPLEGATVMLLATEGTPKWVPGAITDASGTAIVYTNGHFEGAPAGKYKVLVSKTERDPSKLPPAPPDSDPGYADWLSKSESEQLESYVVVGKQYGNIKTTPLETEVVKGSQNETTLDVGKKIREKI